MTDFIERTNRRRTGTIQEQIAADYLVNRGYRILEHNFRCRLGEIDLIAERDEVLVFVEVKYRSTLRAGMPEDAVDVRKQQRIYRTAQYYMLKHAIAEDRSCRFDVVSIYGDEIRHICDAFGGI